MLKVSSENHEIPELHTTGPAETIADDRLERGRFVKNLAEAIRRYKGGNRLTIGLHGPWGSGKSTLLNFLAEELNVGNSNIVVGRFNPWNFSDNDRLLSSFFRFFAGLLKHKDNAKKLELAADCLTGLAELAEPVGSLIDLASLPFGIPPGGKATTAVTKGLAKFLKARAAKLSDIEHLKAEISKALRVADKRFVIIMDDLDRLPQREIRQVFQLIKAGADFDNVVYVVAFERGIVSAALDKFAPGQGERYLEKVINIPFNLPQVTKRQIQRLLIDELNRYSERQREYEWNNERLQSILVKLTPYFKTLRLIDMLSNLLMMMEGMVKDDVDFTDHVGLTMLQVLELTLPRAVTHS
jgi:predicted KAP-like P-loop ATPase